jgi:hypothetical protein
MVFGIVHLVCSVVPGHDVAWVIAVPHQHSVFEHFAQTGAALHPALSKHCAIARTTGKATCTDEGFFPSMVFGL